MSDIPLSDVQLSLFANSFNSTPIATITLAQVIHGIQAGHYRSTVETLRQILACEGKPAYDKAKAHLTAVTFGGIFQPKRGNAYLQAHSGIIQADMDHLTQVAATKHVLSADPRVVYVFISPSAIGLKAGIRVPIVTSDADYKHAWQTAKAAFEQRYGILWDRSGKDVSRLCFISYDPDCYANFGAKIFEVPQAPPPDPRPQLQRLAVMGEAADYRDCAEKAIQTATAMIQSAPMGTRHHTRLRAARLLGGYVAGGMLTEERAYGVLAQALVGHTEDLAKALKTVEDGLAYGEAHPITLEVLEAERQAWLAQYRTTHPRQHGTPPTDLWDGMNTLPLRPYTGWRGMIRGRVQSHG